MVDWIIVVDDDMINLKSAGNILSKNHMRVTALRSGQALLDFLGSNEFPDLILLDVNMPGMDGFDTLKKLRELEDGEEETPVVFLTAENDLNAEIKGLQMGAMDFIRKPFIPDVLVGRVQRVLRTQERLHRFEQAALVDRMTGLLNKEGTEEKMKELCASENGLLCVLDLDAFKPINDLYGHDMGDRVLILFSAVVQKEMRYDDVCGRIGGDEFVLFIKNMKTEKELRRFVARLNETYVEGGIKLIGSQIPLGVSVGAVSVPDHGRDYEQLFHLADEALYTVKQNGKHGCCLYGNGLNGNRKTSDELDLDSITMILEERSAPSSAMWMGKEAFISIYRYMTRYMERYHGVAYRTLFTVRMENDHHTEEERIAVMSQFRKLMQGSLRNSDIMVEISDYQLFLLLPETKDYNIGLVVGRLLEKWEKTEFSRIASISYETGQVHLNRHDGRASEKQRDLIAVVDDDPLNLKLAEHLLTRENMAVTTMRSGQELLSFLREESPDLILLDVIMPEMDGFETMMRMRAESTSARDIPVIFLTADDSRESETKGLQLGAMDFIKKPFVPDVLTLRVRHAIELTRLQNDLSREVSRKTHENNQLFLQVVRALTESIEAKDTYTNGHSARVAEYAREIARRAGCSDEKLSNIYLIGLMHDVGKIGIPDAVINKPSSLTTEEYELIKTHAAKGARILSTISSMPSLATGARWHHERYGGGGYPDGLTGEQIPEEARIIAVADAYDAMTSRRSYREALPQEAVQREISAGIGTQFDPRFARIMLDMIDEDKEFRMREK